MPEYEFSLTRVFPCKDQFCPYMGKMGQEKPQGYD